jgi:hypothetical protein
MRSISLSLWILAAPALFAQDAPVCTNATLKGVYGVTVLGVVPATTVQSSFPSAIYPPGTLEQIVGIVRHVFDGKGGFTQVDNVKGYLSGIILDRPGSGTYSVNADCTGTYSIIVPVPGVPPIVVKFVIVDGGKEFRAIVVSPAANITTANGKRMD